MIAYVLLVLKNPSRPVDLFASPVLFLHHNITNILIYLVLVLKESKEFDWKKSLHSISDQVRHRSVIYVSYYTEPFVLTWKW